MKKINFKKYLILFCCIVAICILKFPYVQSEESNIFIKEILVFWGKDQYVNLVWILSFLLIFYYPSSEFCLQLNRFDMRFQNRKYFIICLLKKNILSVLLVSSTVIFFQILILSWIAKVKIISIPWLFLVDYMIQMIFGITMIEMLYLLIKNYIYSYITLVCFMLLFIIIVGGSTWIPIVSLFSEGSINCFSILLIIINIYFIHRIYCHYDIGGVKNEFKS